MLTLKELGTLLSDTYNNAPRGGQIVNIHLFGIDHAEAISATGITDVVEAAGIPSSLRVELNKGVNLSKFVQRRK